MNPEEFIDQIIDVDLCREAFKLYDKEDSGTIQKTVSKRIQIADEELHLTSLGNWNFDCLHRKKAEKSFIQKEERKVQSSKS